MTKYKILVVDDEESLCEILQFNLEVEGYEVDVAYSAEQALDMHPERYSLILLDVMMGETSGFKMARQLKSRPETAGVPIIFCTARDTEDDTVAGLNIGADDYIAKPFSIREVLARVRSVLRRTAQPAAEEKAVAFEGLRMDLTRKVCTIDGEPLALTKKEFEILALLLSSREKILPRFESSRASISNSFFVRASGVPSTVQILRTRSMCSPSNAIALLGPSCGAVRRSTERTRASTSRTEKGLVM